MPKLIVYHTSYGCETGCCGHAIRWDNQDEDSGAFSFDHPSGWSPKTQEDPLAFAKRLVEEEFGEEHVKDLDWENCEISNC